MSTSSRIGIKNEDGTITSIFCHFDGYPSYNGKILKEHYATEEKIRELMALGDLSSLNKEIGKKHNYNENYNWCFAYGRDKGERNVKAKIHVDMNDFKAYRQEYNYLFENGKWKRVFPETVDFYEEI